MTVAEQNQVVCDIFQKEGIPKCLRQRAVKPFAPHISSRAVKASTVPGALFAFRMAPPTRSVSSTFDQLYSAII
ncbi:hypothetical protein Y1Q_0010857 [Alligator mississippiensis]|uniref:Uncharacterized protein n=1 Tax=Alligator mississippiensis TaxID=8496 RepID=A0A151M750_ALLMI|nr:hypothetical protein Y1Q_0010857 [Alligator mississippiensis]